ncbi:hypothetical protein [Paenibacillus roseipurpureus]|uniref:Uncharacterized protein n=1 Tax=Paenibacillus roseopurpureus TaxID=2918901 RepID=A0AA96LJ18_9BACL|nr:hypothetical protein [Paenibacillus sp. MBLB1832]WNR42737.1 hypothetical protein MJB10_16605 [Paenibacillus sp. MBLB1832]
MALLRGCRFAFVRLTSAGAEENAATAEHLAELAHTLNRLIGEFKVS